MPTTPRSQRQTAADCDASQQHDTGLVHYQPEDTGTGAPSATLLHAVCGKSCNAANGDHS
jgi:hypothetical protein